MSCDVELIFQHFHANYSINKVLETQEPPKVPLGVASIDATV